MLSLTLSPLRRPNPAAGLVSLPSPLPLSQIEFPVSSNTQRTWSRRRSHLVLSPQRRLTDAATRTPKTSHRRCRLAPTPQLAGSSRHTQAVSFLFCFTLYNYLLKIIALGWNLSISFNFSCTISIWLMFLFFIFSQFSNKSLFNCHFQTYFCCEIKIF